MTNDASSKQSHVTVLATSSVTWTCSLFCFRQLANVYHQRIDFILRQATKSRHHALAVGDDLGQLRIRLALNSRRAQIRYFHAFADGSRPRSAFSHRRHDFVQDGRRFAVNGNQPFRASIDRNGALPFFSRSCAVDAKSCSR